MTVFSNVATASGTGAVAIVFAIFLLYIVISAFASYRRLSHINGPFLAKISQLWVARSTLQHRVYLDGEEALKKYGTVTCSGDG